MISLLYVDDEPALLDLGKLFLEHDGQFCVDIITSAKAALDLMDSKNYDAVISDYQMPEMDGIAFLKTIRQQSSVPFILFTGRGREEVVIEAINSGVTFYLQKGGEPQAQFSELAHKIQQAVELARTEKDLTEKIEEINTFFMASVDLLCIVDTEGYFRRVNPSWERLLGYPANELVGKKYLDFVHPDDLTATREALVRLVSQQAVLNYVDRYRCRDGTYRWIEWRAYPSGNRIYAAARDITERKKAEDAIRVAEEKFSTIYCQSPDIIWISELESGLFVDVNNAAVRIFGYTRDEFIGKTSFDLMIWVNPDDRADLIRRIRRDGRVDRFEVIHRRKSGEIFSAESSASTIVLRGKEYLIVTVRDISGMRRAEEALHESEQKYLALIDKANEAVIIAQDCILTFVNDSASRLFKIPVANLVGKKISELIWPDDRDLVITRHLKRLAGENLPDAYDLRIKTSNGKMRWVILSVARIQWQGRPATLNLLTDITDRKRAEAALRMAEENYRNLVENSYDTIYTMSPEGIFTYVSPSVTSRLGFSPTDLEGKSFELFMHPDDVPQFRMFLQKTKSEKTRQRTAEYRGRHADGSWRWHVSKLVPLFDENGNVICLEGIASDIPNWKMNEERLRAAEEKFFTIYRQSPDIIWISELESGRFIDVNDAAVRIFGYVREEFIGNTSFDLGLWVNLEDRARMMQVILKDGRIDRFETRHRRKNGEEFEVESSVSTILLGDRKFLISTIRDVSGIKRIENALMESELKYRTLADKANETILIAQDSCIVFANGSASSLLGMLTGSIIGRPFIDFVWHEDRELVSTKYQKRIVGETISEVYDFRIISADNKLKWVFMSGTRIMWQGRPATLNLLTDITDRKRAEAALREVNKKLNLLSSITRHDINNQLVVLGGFLGLLQQEVPRDPAYDRYFTRMNDALNRIASMIQFTKQYDQIGVSTPVWQNCRALADTAVRDATLGHIVMKNDFPARVEVFADPLIVKVFYNLIDNAVRYGEKITEIHFFLVESVDCWNIICEDNGVGIPAEEKIRIFERGFGKNTGMGLYLAREILGITGIMIHETGVPGKGARFMLILPKDVCRIAGTIQ